MCSPFGRTPPASEGTERVAPRLIQDSSLCPAGLLRVHCRDVAEEELAALVEAARDGDQLAWKMLVARYLDLVWAIARGHSLDHCDAADVSQTTWLRLYEQLPRLREPEKVGAWVATTARRESLRISRQRRRQRAELLPADCPSTAPAVEDSLPELVAERDRLFWSAFGDLTPPCKRLLRALMADPPPSYAEVSAALGMPVGSIGPTRARCLERLRAHLLNLSAPRGREAL